MSVCPSVPQSDSGVVSEWLNISFDLSPG